MPQLLLAALCDDVRIELGGKHSLMGIFDQFALSDFTQPLPPFRIFAVLGIDDPEEHHLIMKIQSAKGGTALDFTGQIQAKTLSEPSGLYVVPINLGFSGMKLPQLGVYKVSFILDDVDLGGIPFAVRVVLPAPEG